MTDRPPRLTVELHCHTCYSTDSLLTPAALLEAARRKSIDRVIITDHNTTRGAQIAATLDPVRVIVGEEIMTTKGELLAFFVQEELPAGLEAAEAIERLRRQGAVISVSHPFDAIRHGSWSEAELRAILPLVDAVEIFNARTWSRSPNDRAARLAAEAGLPGTAGSDAHTAFELGRSGMRLAPFHDAAGLLASIRSGEVITRLSPSWVHLYSRYAAGRKRLGWRPPP
jgi:predicted metal-dependent phosphoesterase TrpH